MEDENSRISERAYDAARRVHEEHNFPHYIDNTETKLYNLLHAVPDINGKRVLDLGCGSVLSSSGLGDNRCDEESPKKKRIFEPWVCRALPYLGAHPIGVDIGSLEGERFEHYGGVDFRSEDSLLMIPSSSIDVVHTSLLYDSPQLERLAGRGARDGLVKVLTPQIVRVLKPGGAFVSEPLSKGYGPTELITDF